MCERTFRTIMKCFTFEYNAVNINLFRPNIVSKMLSKKGRGALFSKQRGCYVLVIQEFISLTC